MSSKPNITSASKPVVLAQTIINKTAEKLKGPTKQAQSVANKEERLHMMATSDYYRAERSGGVRSDEIQDWLEEAGEAIDNTTP